MGTEFFDILNLAFGIACIYWGIIGRGYPYKNNYPKKIKKFAKKLIRICLLISGVSFLGSFAVSYFFTDEATRLLIHPWNIVYIALTIIGFGSLVAFVAILYAKHGKDIKAAQRAQDKPKYYKG